MRSGVIRTLLSVALFLGCAAAQTEAPRFGYPRDWSHGGVIFTNGGTARARAAAQKDPRLFHELLYRNSLTPDSVKRLMKRDAEPRRSPQIVHKRATLTAKDKNLSEKIDWAVSLGTSGGMPAGQTPAKYVFDAFASVDLSSCVNDFVVFVISATPGVGTQANVVAFNNLYTGPNSSYCPNGPQTPPTSNLTQATFMWSYAVGGAGVVLSPTLSLDGSKVAIVENSSPAIFRVLTWVAGQGTNATTGSVAPGSGGSSATSLSYTNTTVAGCPANPAMNSNSSPYIDYSGDAAYIGADNGVLYRIKNVFGGTPSLDYCITVSSGNKLTSPVFDSVSNQVFVSDGKNLLAFTPGLTSFTPSGSIQVGFDNSSVVSSPIVDSTNGFVYTFANAGTSGTNAVVSQVPVSLASKVDTNIGRATTSGIMSGAFDDKYYSLGPSAGTLYACGVQSSNAGKPSLYAISFQATGIMNSVPPMSDNRNINGNSNMNGTCSPLTAFSDGTNDRLFAGTGVDGSGTGSNVVTMWSIDSRISSPDAEPSAIATDEIGGTSGFAIDNTATVPEASSIYFGTLARGSSGPCGNNYCAVKLTRSALQ